MMMSTSRVLLGVLVLLTVDVLWVSSSELTSSLFHQMSFSKPLFTTYVKTSLFTLYFVLVLLTHQTSHPLIRRFTLDRQRLRDYLPIINEDEHDSNENPNDNHVATNGSDSQASDVANSSSSPNLANIPRSISSPTLVPANIPPSDKSSANDDDDDEDDERSDNDEKVDNDRKRRLLETRVHTRQLPIHPHPPSRRRRVRFHSEAQVVEMNPADALYANLSRLSYQASLRAQSALQRAACRLSVEETAQLALLFLLPWFLGNCAYQIALSHTQMATVVNVLSSCSSLFTLLMAATFPSVERIDRFTLTKLAAVMTSISGVAVVCYSDFLMEDKVRDKSTETPSATIPAEASFWALLGAFCYALYIVLLRRKVSHEDHLDSRLFFAFVGLFNALLLWPILVIAHFTGQEPFELPNKQQFQVILANGLLGTVLSEILWLYGCFLTSSLLATLAISLTIPLSIIADVLLWKQEHSEAVLLLILGALPIFVSFVLVALLTYYEDWDPIGSLCRKVANELCCCLRIRRQRIQNDDHNERSNHEEGEQIEERELLITDEQA